MRFFNGSSPRVRGTPHTRPRAEVHRRFIPACAGNAIYQRTLFRPRPVHPRVCGERLLHPVNAWNQVGSSPRVRGTPTRIYQRTLFRRFIPACAGNASIGSRATGALTVHPRVCGERPGVNSPFACNPGSSPRVRGTHGSNAPEPCSVRFIPACAGNARVVQLSLIHISEPTRPY